MTAPEGISFSSYLQIYLNINSNLIIPYGTTLDCNSIQLYYNNSSSSSNILILGTITNVSQPYGNSYCLYLYYGTINVIIGPNAKYDCNKTDKSTPIRYRCDSMSCILYPGCTISTSDIDNALSNNKYTINQYNGYLYLNRYVQNNETYKLVGNISYNSHIVYQKEMEDGYIILCFIFLH